MYSAQALVKALGREEKKNSLSKHLSGSQSYSGKIILKVLNYGPLRPFHPLRPGDRARFALAPLLREVSTLVLFIWLIIRLIQLIFSAGTIFFSHKKSADSVFQPAYNSSRTAALSVSAQSCLSWSPRWSNN
jgi:hypothetical protein